VSGEVGLVLLYDYELTSTPVYDTQNTQNAHKTPREKKRKFRIQKNQKKPENTRKHQKNPELDFFHDLDNVFISEFVLLANLLRVVFNTTAPY